MAKPVKRKVRMDQFKKQINEKVGTDDLCEVEYAQGESVFIRLGFAIEGGEEQESFEASLRASDTADEVARLILGFHPERSAEEQLEAYTNAGYTVDDLTLVFAAETSDLRERLGKFRYKG